MEHAPKSWKPTARHAALVVAAMYLPYFWILFHSQRPYLLEAFPFLPGLLPAAALFGQKTSERLVAGVIVAAGLALLVALGVGSRRRARVVEGVTLALGCVLSFSLHEALKM